MALEEMGVLAFGARSLCLMGDPMEVMGETVAPCTLWPREGCRALAGSGVEENSVLAEAGMDGERVWMGRGGRMLLLRCRWAR